MSSSTTLKERRRPTHKKVVFLNSKENPSSSKLCFLWNKPIKDVFYYSIVLCICIQKDLYSLLWLILSQNFFFFFFWIWQVLPNNKEKRRLFTCIMQRGKCCWPWFNECLRGCCCRGCPKRPPKLSQIYMNLFTALLHIRKENPYRVVLNVKWVSLIYFSRSIWLSQKKKNHGVVVLLFDAMLLCCISQSASSTLRISRQLTLWQKSLTLLTAQKSSRWKRWSLPLQNCFFKKTE